MASSSASAGVSLLDVLDVHYYTDGSANPQQCMQNPRMFWDPQYTDLSPTTVDSIDFRWPGYNDYFDTAWYPRAVVPRLLQKIAIAYSSSAPALAFSEYNSGCETSIAGGIAEADDLGIFGREGVFAAAAMPSAPVAGNYLVAAYDLYRNYDGNGTTVGDTAVSATTSDVGSTSVYAFVHSSDRSQLEVVAINKTVSSASAAIVIGDAPSFGKATAYQLVDGSPAVAPVSGPAIAFKCADDKSCSLTYKMPPKSATTIVFR
jgi:mannan endo-1,4-beta-mannosidase